jgi:hypothetical protein
MKRSWRWTWTIGAVLVAVPVSAGPIRASVDRLAEQAVAEQATVCAPTASDSERLRCLEARLNEVKRVADDSVSCVVTHVAAAGGDVLATEIMFKRCPTCAEANIAGFNGTARVALKLLEVGAQIGACYETAKHSHSRVKKLQWAGRIWNYFWIAVNAISAAMGKPLIPWGVGTPAGGDAS